ncbi:MAG: hypothetical protein VW378_01335 [bacterium]
MDKKFSSYLNKTIRKEKENNHIKSEGNSDNFNNYNITITTNKGNVNNYLKNIIRVQKEGDKNENIAILQNLNKEIENADVRAIVLLALSYHQIGNNQAFIANLIPALIQEYYLQTLYYQIEILKVLYKKIKENKLSNENKEKIVAFCLAQKTINSLYNLKNKKPKKTLKELHKIAILVKAEAGFLQKLDKIQDQ